MECEDIYGSKSMERSGGIFPSVALRENRHLNGCPQQHMCSRFCAIEHVFGNMYRCASTGSMHVCDYNCNQRIFYDNYHTICRLSRKLFTNVEIEEARKQSAMLRKRGSGHLGGSVLETGRPDALDISDDVLEGQEQQLQYSLSAKRPTRSPGAF